MQLYLISENNDLSKVILTHFGCILTFPVSRWMMLIFLEVRLWGFLFILVQLLIYKWRETNCTGEKRTASAGGWKQVNAHFSRTVWGSYYTQMVTVERTIVLERRRYGGNERNLHLETSLERQARWSCIYSLQRIFSAVKKNPLLCYFALGLHEKLTRISQALRILRKSSQRRVDISQVLDIFLPFVNDSWGTYYRKLFLIFDTFHNSNIKQRCILDIVKILIASTIIHYSKLQLYILLHREYVHMHALCITYLKSEQASLNLIKSKYHTHN